MGTIRPWPGWPLPSDDEAGGRIGMGSPKAGGATERVSVELATATATAPSCCAKNSGCSTTCPTPTSHQRTWTPGSPGPPAHVYGRSSGSPAPSAATATVSSQPSASASQWEPRRPQQRAPPDQPPRLRLSLRRPPDRARLPLLQRRHRHAPAIDFTPNSDEAPLRVRVRRPVPAETEQRALPVIGSSFGCRSGK